MSETTNDIDDYSKLPVAIAAAHRMLKHPEVVFAPKTYRRIVQTLLTEYNRLRIDKENDHWSQRFDQLQEIVRRGFVCKHNPDTGTWAVADGGAIAYGADLVEMLDEAAGRVEF